MKICTFNTINRLSFNPDNRLALDQSCAWAVKTRKLLRQLIRNLEATINQLEHFQANRKFSTITGPTARCFSTILATTRQLRIILQQLKFLHNDCDGYIHLVSSYIFLKLVN